MVVTPVNTPMSKPSEQSALHYFEALTTAVAQFNRVWPTRAQDAGMFELPAYARDKRRDLVPDTIAPVYLQGKSAIALAQQAVKQFKRRSYQNPLSVIRFPGWVSTTQTLIDEINIINELKEGLQETIKLIEPDDAARIHLTRRLFPGVSMLQVYRSIACHHEPVDRLEFTWSPMTMATRKLDKSKTIQQLETSLAKSPPAEFESRATWRAVVEKEIRDIVNLGNGELVQRKPIAPHPKVMVYFREGRDTLPVNKYDAIHNASLPIFIRADESLSVSPLKTFVFDRGRKPVGKGREYRWISKPLGIAVRV